MIISTSNYTSFKALGLMDELEASLKYVPTYQAIARIKKEEQLIAKKALQVEKKKVKEVQAEKKKIEREKETLIMALLERKVSVENSAKILDTTPKTIEKIIQKNTAS